VAINWELKTPNDARRYLDELPRLKFADPDQIKAIALLEFAEVVINDPPPRLEDKPHIRQRVYAMQWVTIKDILW
jgi:hypothetical protein